MLRNKWMQVLIIFFVSTIIWGIIEPNSPHFDGIARLTGAGISMLVIGLLFSHIPATIVRLVSGSWPIWQIWLSLPFIAAMMYFSYTGLSAPSPKVAEGYWFTEEECELAVRFPGRPSYRTNHGPDGIQVPEASYNTEGGFNLRAECTNYGGLWDNGFVSAQDLVSWMSQFMSAEGFSNPQISMKDHTLGSDFVVVDGRGYKILSEVRITYVIRLVAADKSIMILYAGGPSGRFPSNEASAFLDSYRSR